MALSADTPRTYVNEAVRIEAALPVQASTTIYAGSALTIDSGGEVGPVTAGDTGFVGFARKGTAGVTAGDTNAAVYTEGYVVLTVTGVDDNNDIGDIVYASDDGTFTLTSSTAFFAIGKVHQIISLSAGTCVVHFTSLHNEHWND